ncbi:MAG: VWA domain-containing protein [Acidobacteriaceae bacterium]
MHRRSKGFLGVLLVVTVAQFAAQAQSGSSDSMPLGYREMLEVWPQLGFDVTVLDRHAGAVDGFTKQQMQVDDNDQAVAGFDLVPSGNDPQSVCIVVDNSGSTYADRDLIRRSVLKLIDDLPAKDEICVINFSVLAYVDSELTQDRDKLRADIKFMKAYGESAVYDSLVKTTNYLIRKARFRSRVIVLLSDGDDNKSKMTRSEMVRALHAPGAPVVYALANLAAGAHEDYHKKEDESLKMLAHETGGVAWFPKRDIAVDDSVASLIQTLDHRYRLILTTASARDGSMHKLRVTLDRGLQKQKMTVNATRGFDAALP